MSKDMMTVKCGVGCHTGDGPDIYFVKVQCTQEQYDAGLHYEAAEGYVEENYDVEGPYWVFDEFDPARPLMSHAVWDSMGITQVD